MIKILLFLLICLLTGNKTVKSQDISESANYYNSAIIKKCDTLFYYGVDFSHVRITDASKTSKSLDYSKVYPQAWITYIEEEMPPDDFVERSLRKEKLYYRQNEISLLSVNVVPGFIIGQSYSFPIDTIKQAIKTYDLKQNSGIGLVLIPENFNKPKEKATTWVVFFDIGKREIIWASKVTGKCEQMGYTAHWASGIIDGIKKFIRFEYR